MPDPGVDPLIQSLDDRTTCVSCDRPKVIGGFCLPCAAGEELQLTEDERIKCRDLIATFLIDKDGTHRYDVADAIWLTLYRAGFDIMRRPVAEMHDA